MTRATLISQIPENYARILSPFLVQLTLEGFSVVSDSWPFHPGKCRFVRAPACLMYECELESYCFVVWLFILASYRRNKLPEMTSAQISKGTFLSLRHTQRALAHLVESKLLTRTRTKERDIYQWEATWKDEWIWCPISANLLGRSMPAKAKAALIRLMPLVISNTPRIVHLYTQEFAQVTGCPSVRRAYELCKLLREHGFIRTGPVQRGRGPRTEHEIDLLGEGIFASRFIEPVATGRLFKYVSVDDRAARRLQITKVGRLL